MFRACKAAKFDVMASVDTITGGNRERDSKNRFYPPPKLTLSSLSFATKPMWGINYLTKGKFELPHLQDFVKEEVTPTHLLEIIFPLC